MYKNTFYVYYKDSDISHHGIKGQRWGYRRFQNPDGSLTAAGERRYGKHREAADRLLAQDMPTGSKSMSKKYNRDMVKVITKAAKKGDRDYVEKLTEKMAPYYNREEVESYANQLIRANKSGFLGGLFGGAVGGAAVGLANAIEAANRDKKARAREGLQYMKENTDIYNTKMNELYKEKYGKKEGNSSTVTNLVPEKANTLKSFKISNNEKKSIIEKGGFKEVLDATGTSEKEFLNSLKPAPVGKKKFKDGSSVEYYDAKGLGGDAVVIERNKHGKITLVYSME